MAYALAALKVIKAKDESNYHLTVDSKSLDIRTLACEVYNAGNMGVAGTSLIPGISVEDGLLDLLVVRENVSRVLWTHDIEHSIRPGDDLFDHWQARQICIESDPPQPLHIDGEMVGTTPVIMDIPPRAIRVWEAPSGAHVRTLRAERRYGRLHITTGLTGITDAQRQALLMLGAVEDEGSTSPEQVAQP